MDGVEEENQTASEGDLNLHLSPSIFQHCKENPGKMWEWVEKK